VNLPASTPDDASAAFHDYAEAQAAATLRTLIAQAAKPALTELEALRVAIGVRCESLTATLAGAGITDPAPVRELVERLAHAAGEEAGAAARAARTLALEEAEARLQLDRIEAQKQLDAMRAEAEEERTASQLERAALADALEKTTRQADAVRQERDAHFDALRRAQEQAEAVRADRDAQLEALRTAQEQADALRADRDAQLDALRTAQEQADALRADRDAQLDALRTTQEQADALRADRDAQLRAAESAREEARTVQSEQDALLEAARISNARHSRLLEQAEARAEAAQAEAAAAQTLANTAQGQLAAAHAQAEAAQAQFAAAQAHLAAVQEELAVAQAEAERRLAVGASEIEALRLELERVRASLQAAREEPARVAPVFTEPQFSSMAPAPAEAVAAVVIEHPVAPAPAATPAIEFTAETTIEPVAEPVLAVEPVFETAIEFVSQPPIEAAAEPAPEWQAVDLVEHPSQAEPPSAVTAMADPGPVAADVDPVRDVSRAISDAADLSQVLDALVDGVGALFPRAALFVVKTKSKRLQGWRSVGFTGVAAITREFEFPLTTDSALTRAVTASRTIFTGDAQSPAHSAEAWTVTFPVTTGGRVVAVVHADGGARSGEPAAAFDRETALDLGHTLVRMAGERIGALTMSARAAFGSVMNVAPADSAPVSVTPADVNGARVNGTSVNGSHAGPRVDVAPKAAIDGPDPAGLVASQLVSEINRYSQAAATAAPVDGLRERLAGQIDGARTQAAPAEPATGTALGLFDEALGKMLGNGALEQASVPIPSI
jgi:hypothetical protein